MTRPIALHVAAKRYLCAVVDDYLTSLSPASIASLAVQGGAFEEVQVKSGPAHSTTTETCWWSWSDDDAGEPGGSTGHLMARGP